MGSGMGNFIIFLPFSLAIRFFAAERYLPAAIPRMQDAGSFTVVDYLSAVFSGFGAYIHNPFRCPDNIGSCSTTKTECLSP
ncbi:MAG: hypothetical protein IPH45_16015 [Bacteroidales bacterium]|nr:hypothetical protein [Bacteroidales bacterium]